jgi:hypothetical protein
MQTNCKCGGCTYQLIRLTFQLNHVCAQNFDWSKQQTINYYAIIKNQLMNKNYIKKLLEHVFFR